MKKPIFKAEQFTPTQWDSAEQKARFANHFVRFLESGFNRNLFYKWFYNRLSMTFGHIAHYNQWAFYEYWFSNEEKCRRFVQHTLHPACGGCGYPAYTYSDVEMALKKFLKDKGETYTLFSDYSE